MKKIAYETPITERHICGSTRYADPIEPQEEQNFFRCRICFEENLPI